ncbi:MAG: M56 family metallopeptidase [Verrucomicrobiia bacterium]|jgi:hypothetical protein
MERDSRPANGREVCGVFQELHSVMRLSRRVRLRIADGLLSPVAMGVVWPVVILPTWLLTGAPPDLLRAILAHELAHIRRHDYLVNLFQLLVETALFFNPAIWWISRQIRIEREACCDLAASRECGDKFEYAEAMADYAAVASTGVMPEAAMGFWERDAGGTLMDRVRRLLEPGYRSSMQVGLRGAIVFLAVGGIALAGLQRGTDYVVRAGARWLTPEERIAAIEVVHESLKPPPRPTGPFSPQSTNRMELVGKIVFEGLERDAPQPLIGFRRVNSSFGGVTSSSIEPDGSFNTRIDPPGPVYLDVTAEGYAPASFGPFEAGKGESRDNLRLPLSRGFKALIQFQDAEGLPIPGVEMKGQYKLRPRFQIADHVSDGQGMVALSHCAKGEVDLEVWAAGFQHERRKYHLQSSEQHIWKLSTAESAKIQVTSAVTGFPLKNARAFLVSAAGPHPVSRMAGRSMREMGVSDEGGFVEIGQLRESHVYRLAVYYSGHQPQLVEDIKAGGPLRKIALGPEVYVKGKFVGDLNVLESVVSYPGPKNRTYIHYSNYPSLGGAMPRGESGMKYLDIIDQEAHFEIRELWAGSLFLRSGSFTRTLTLDAARTNVVIDLDAPVQSEREILAAAGKLREVEIRLSAPEGHPTPRGKLVLSSFRIEPRNHRKDFQDCSTKIRDGVARVELEVGRHIECRAGGLTGYWFKTEHHPIDSGERPMVIEVNCHPAGIVHGAVFESDGTPAKGFRFSFREVRRPSGPSYRELGLSIGKGYDPDSRESPHRFSSGPLPIPGTYQILAQCGLNYMATREISLTAERPILRLDWRLVPGIDVDGVVLNEDGAPVSKANMSLRYSLGKGIGGGTIGSASSSDWRGRFSVKDINPELPGGYQLLVKGGVGYQSAMVDLPLRGADVSVTLKRAEKLRVQLIDHETNLPIPNFSIHLMQTNSVGSARGKSDAEGWVTFSTLGEGVYQVFMGDVRLFNRNGLYIFGERNERAVARLVYYDYSKPKREKSEATPQAGR